jgi:hypothetical protein
MANSLEWSLLSLNQVTKLQLDLEPTEQGTTQFRDTLASFLNLSLSDIDAKTEVLLDFHFYNMVFCKDSGFNPTKTATFCGIMKTLLDEDTAAAHRDIRQSFERLKILLLEHSVDRPPWSVGVFDESDIDPMLQFSTNSYFRHFRLYRMTMAPRVQLELNQHNPGFVELPTTSRPLSEAVEITGEVDELQLSEKELQIVKEEVIKRMQPIKDEFEEEAVSYRNIIDKMNDEKEENESKNDKGKKKRK